MSRYQVQMLASVPGMPAGGSATATDVFEKLFADQGEAERFATAELDNPPPAHTAQVVDVTTGAVVWEKRLPEREL